MPPVINQEWLDRNSSRAYPFKENMQRIPVGSGGTLIPDAQIPNYVIADLVLTVPGDAPARAYVSQIAIAGNLLTLILSDFDDTQIASLAVDTDAHTTYDGYNITGTGSYSDVRGRIVLGDLSSLSSDIAEGVFTFTPAQTELEASVVRPAVRGVRSLKVNDNGAESDFIYGHVKLLAGSNIRLTYLSGYNTIRIDALDGEGFSEECECDPAVGQNNIVKTINGIAIEDAEIIGDGECVNVNTEGNKIVISDTCSAPCCGCPELEFITDSLKILETTMDNLQNYSQQLSERISNFVTAFILTIG